MIIGIPTEIKNHEYRVSMTPGGVRELIDAGHQVLVQCGAGQGSGFPDEEYAAVGARLVPTSADAWAAELVVKVKEPQPDEYAFLGDDMLLFTYLHLAAEERLTRELLARKQTSIAYETVELADGRLPLLTPMSEVAGRMAVQVGAHHLEMMQGGRGVLLGGVPGVLPANVVIIGGGIVGTNAAQMALGMGAAVTILDSNLDRLRYLDQVLHGRCTTLSSNMFRIERAVAGASLVIGAVLVKGAKAPRLVTRNMIAQMTPGSVVVDVAVDQGGCFETTRPTTHSDPTFVVDQVVHYCVTNMPGAVPRTSTLALSNVTLPYVLLLADRGFVDAVQSDSALARGVNTCRGTITYASVAEAFGLDYTPLAEVLV